ncbi:MAG TPA: hypothetical protein VNZ53_27820 [Steroidobacteraceae bacterium]|jgi:hypothetical protein|nr:hypothetical protein [Steroidobacteraceae bacterium]
MSKSLVGKTIVAVFLTEDGGEIRFDLSDGTSVVARADGDCCSHSWIEAVEMPALGLPATVISSEPLDLDKPDVTNDDYECLRFYGHKIVTDRGEIVIDYRNSSNGYYGGNLSWPEDDYFYGGVFGQNISNGKWRQL